MDALYALFNPLVAIVNRRIGESTPARELAATLDGRTIAVRVRRSALALAVTVNDGVLSLTTVDDIEPDAIIEGSLLTLARLAGPEGEALIRSGEIELTGDALVANDFRNLLRHGRPDLEEQLSFVVGDAAAHGIGEAARRVGRWGREAGRTMTQNIGEYLQEESRALPTRYEFEEFRGEVEALRDAVARAEARVRLLEEQGDDA